MPQARRPAAKKKSAIEVPVDPLASFDEAENVADLYVGAAKRRNHLKALAVANDHQLDDVPPGTPQKVVDGTAMFDDGKPVHETYREQMEGYITVMNRLKLAYASIWHVVEKVIEQRRKQLEEAAKS